MRIDCPNCHKRLKVSADTVGKRIRCPQCDMRFVLPAQAVTEEPQAAASSDSKLAALSAEIAVVEPDKEAVIPDPERNGILIGTDEGHRFIESRAKQHGVVRMILGSALLLIGVVSIFLSRFFPWTLFGTLVCIGQGARELYWGINAYISYIVPENFPADIQRTTAGGEDVVETLLLKRLIVGTYMVPAGFLKRLAISFVPRFRYLTPAQMPLFSTAGNLVVAAGLGIPVVVIVFAIVGFHPLPIFTEMVLIGATVAAVIALQACEPGERNPKEVVIEQPEEQRYFTTGNPTDLINHLKRDVFLSIREQQRFNRDLWPPPEIQPGVSFSAVMGQETEPLLIDESTHVPLSVPVLLERTGAGLVAGGWLFLFFLPSQYPFLNGVVAVPAIAIGWWFLALSFRMRNSFRFTSDVFRLELHGSSTARQATTEIMGSAGTEQREVLHTSQVYWLLHAARVVTECSMAAHFTDRNIAPSEGTRHALLSPRYIVRVIHSPQLQERVDILVRKLTQYRDVRESRDQEAADRMEGRARERAALDHRLEQERIRLEQQLRLEGEFNLEQLRQQGKLREKLMEKMIEQMDPQELRKLTLGDLMAPSLPRASEDVDVASQPSPADGATLNSQLIALLRRYLDRSKPAEDRLAAKDEFDDLVRDHNVAPERVDQLTALVTDELSREQQ